MLRGISVAAGLVLVAVIAVAKPAFADGQNCTPQTVCTPDGKCETKLVCSGEEPGAPGSPETPPVNDTPGKSVCRYNGKDIPCEKNGFWWSADSGCYFKQLPPAEWPNGPGQPGGNDPNGSYFAYYCPPTPDGAWEYTWRPQPPPGYGGPGVNPRDLAEQAIAQMQLTPINIGIIPKPGADKMGAVGLPVWMWVNHPNDHAWGPISAMVSAGGVSVTATANVKTVNWNMGDGTTVTCGQGKPYILRYGTSPSPSCGHLYATTSWHSPGHAFTVTATSYWVVTWAGGGQNGEIPVELSSNVPIRIGELQALTTE